MVAFGNQPLIEKVSIAVHCSTVSVHGLAVPKVKKEERDVDPNQAESEMCGSSTRGLAWAGFS